MDFTEEQKKEALDFYQKALNILNESGSDFMLGGAFALFHYTGIYRDTKDLDIFCKSSDYPKILKTFAGQGYRTELTDSRWIAKVFNGEYYLDIIFDTPNNICVVDDSWIDNAFEIDFAGVKVKVLPAEELIWCKIYVQNRDRYDGADINHILLKHGKELDWKRILQRMDRHWHLLLSQILNFQFVYPSDYPSIIPKWLFDELLKRAQEQYDLPPPQARVCRGPIIDQSQYSTDIIDWNYKVYTMKTI